MAKLNLEPMYAKVLMTTGEKAAAAEAECDEVLTSFLSDKGDIEEKSTSHCHRKGNVILSETEPNRHHNFSQMFIVAILDGDPASSQHCAIFSSSLRRFSR